MLDLEKCKQVVYSSPFIPRHDLEHQLVYSGCMKKDRWYLMCWYNINSQRIFEHSWTMGWVFARKMFLSVFFDSALQTLELDLLSCEISVIVIWECPVWPEAGPGSAGSVPYGVRIFALISNLCPWVQFFTHPSKTPHEVKFAQGKHRENESSPTVCLYTPVTSNFVNNALLMQINSA